MRELVDRIGSDAVPDPMKSAGGASDLPKRFYENATNEETVDGFELRLDGRVVRTPGRNVVRVGKKIVGDALAFEWASQGERIDPRVMPVTRIVNSAIDGVSTQMEPVRRDVVAYARNDLLCYRAEGPDGLVRRQADHWDPVLDRFADELGARFVLAEGIMPLEQPAHAIDAVIGELDAVDDPLRLAALHVVTTLTGSALLAVALMRGWRDLDAVWDAAHVDEDWNRELWGADEEAEARRAYQRRDMDAAALILKT